MTIIIVVKVLITLHRQQPRQPADISQFLVAAPVWELKQMRRLCHLTSLTYKMHLVTPRALRRKHALDLVTTSWACEVRTYEPNKTAIEIASEGDGMAMSMSEALAATAAGPAAIAAAPGSTSRLAAPFQSTTGSPACPSEWLVCDDPASAVRYFVIQGSDTFDHWKLNLTFDPVIFEDPGLGVKVHRGVYEAAQILYKRFLPMVCFTPQHAAGLMYIRRGVLPPSSLATIYTYGAPAVFCEFSTPSPSSSATPGPTLPTRHTLPYHPREEGGDGAGLLAKLGLHMHSVRNVIMARDIVSRACDYSLVADILKGWGAGFKSHGGLLRPGRKHFAATLLIPTPAGRSMVMQPDRWHWFAGSDTDHPLLPRGRNFPDADLGHPDPQVCVLPCPVWCLPGAYLERGSISRFHNPDNYTAALGRIIYHQRQAEGKVPSWVLSAYSRGLGLLAAEEAAEAELGQGQGHGWAGQGQATGLGSLQQAEGGV
ncbi:hypothetical protein V8C86DRAFT_3015692 [Haematococcus lacustris]